MILDPGNPPLTSLDIKELLIELVRLQALLYGAINTNETYIKYISQNSQPTVPAGEIWLWKDADATTGQPTHYLVANSGATTVTFKSDQLVP